jgi:sugar phosphate isomerase/epimerase
MISRRSFLKSSAVFAAGTLILPACNSSAAGSTIGLQLYTVRDAMANDPIGTLERVAKIGYNSVEGATYTGTMNFYGMDAAQFSSVLKDHGLIMPSNHYLLGLNPVDGADVQGTMLHNWEKAVADAAELGLSYMVCAYLFETERGDIDQYKKVAEWLNKAGEVAKKSGIQVCYHNHAFEFEDQNGALPYDILLNDTDAELVKMELDLYWVSKAKHDPVELFKLHPNRFPLWHVKDMDKTSEQNFTEVGNGSIDFQRIFDQAEVSGMKYFFVEQDSTPGSPFDSITQSIGYIKKNLK